MAADWYREEWADAGAALSLSVAEKLADQQSDYQRVEVFQTTHFGKLLTLDGLVMLTERDHFIYHEMLAHPALFTHPTPRKVAIVGGGDCGLLTEVLKHDSVETVTQIEIDPAVTEVALHHFPDFAAAKQDPRAQLRFIDGAAWVKEMPDAALDVLLIDSTDPIGPAAQLFEQPFLEQCHRALGRNGILAMQSESPLFHADLIRTLWSDLRACGWRNVATLSFPQCSYPSGWWSVTLAGDRDLDEWRSLPSAVATRYYTDAIHQGARALPRFLLDDS